MQKCRNFKYTHCKDCSAFLVRLSLRNRREQLCLIARCGITEPCVFAERESSSHLNIGCSFLDAISEKKRQFARYKLPDKASIIECVWRCSSKERRDRYGVSYGLFDIVGYNLYHNLQFISRNLPRCSVDRPDTVREHYGVVFFLEMSFTECITVLQFGISKLKVFTNKQPCIENRAPTGRYQRATSGDSHMSPLHTQRAQLKLQRFI